MEEMIRNKKFRVGLLLAFLVIAIISVPCLPTFARAGGGENYQAPSSGGGVSGGSRGDDGGEGLVALVLLFFRLPLPLKIVVLIVIIIVISRASKKKKMLQSGGHQSWNSLVGTATDSISSDPSASNFNALQLPDISEQLAQLKARDPKFSEQQFEDMASSAFFKIQEAWTKRDMSIARSFVTPDLLQRFQAQIDRLKNEGKINRVENLAVGSVEIVEADRDGGNDYITVRINASCSDYMVDEKTGKLLSGSKEIKPFTEYWTFIRSGDVKTSEGSLGLVANHCPNCGAPISINALGKCDYCGSEVSSGRYSWVLSEITQASVFRPRAKFKKPPNISPLGAQRYVLGLVQCPNCKANVQDIAGITNERCWRCGAIVSTKS